MEFRGTVKWEFIDGFDNYKTAKQFALALIERELATSEFLPYRAPKWHIVKIKKTFDGFAFLTEARRKRNAKL